MKTQTIQNQPNYSSSLITLGASLVLGVTVVAVTHLTTLKVGDYLMLQKAKLRAEAVDNCLKATQIETTRQVEDEKKSLHITEPVKEIYVYCLQDKGFAHEL